MKFDIYRREVRLNGSDKPTLSFDAVSSDAIPEGCRRVLSHAIINCGKNPYNHAGRIEVAFGERKLEFLFRTDKRIDCSIPAGIASEVVNDFFARLGAEIDRLYPFYKWADERIDEIKTQTATVTKSLADHQASIDQHGNKVADKLYADLLERVEAAEKAFAALQEDVKRNVINVRAVYMRLQNHDHEHHEGSCLSRLIRHWRRNRNTKLLRSHATGVAGRDGERICD